MRFFKAVLLVFLVQGAISAWVPGQWVDDAQMKIWDEFIASRGSEWSSASSIASPEASHDTKNQKQTPNELPVQEFSAANYEENAEIDDKFGAAPSGNVALPCGCPYHTTQAAASNTEGATPSCGCTHSETKPLVSQEPLLSQPIQQSPHFSAPIAQPPSSAVTVESVNPSCGCVHTSLLETKPLVSQEPLLSQPIQQSPHFSPPVAQPPSSAAAVESVNPSCGCVHTSLPASSQEPILVPVPPLAPQLPLESPVLPSCGCSHHAPAQPTTQDVQQSIQQTPQAQHPQSNQNCGCVANAPKKEPTLPNQAPAIYEENQQQNCNQKPNPQPISSVAQQISPIPAISQPKMPILPCSCAKVPKTPIFGSLEHLNRPYSHAQSSNPSVLNHISSSAPVQSIPQGPAANSASQYYGCSSAPPVQNPAASSCNQAQKQSEKTATNSQYSSYTCQSSENQKQPKPAHYYQQYKPIGQQYTATNQNTPCKCSRCSKAHDWSNHSDGRKPLDWVKHLFPF